MDHPEITPWPIPKDAPALLFGGTFDPPHRGHIDLAVRARDAVMPSTAWLVLVPAGRNPHKTGGPRATAEQRVEMLELASAGDARTTTWTDETDRAAAGGPSYWADTLDRARVVRGSLEGVRFLIGTDQAVAFHRWARAREILDAADPVVLPRGEIAEAGSLRAALAATGAWSVAELDRWCAWLAPVGRVDTSSTAARGGDLADLHPEVRDYIRARGLYASA